MVSAALSAVEVRKTVAEWEMSVALLFAAGSSNFSGTCPLSGDQQAADARRVAAPCCVALSLGHRYMACWPGKRRARE